MEGYRDTSYGDVLADVYDDWYGDLGDLDTMVTTLADLADLADLAELVGGGPILELGVGTGRVALPLAARGLEVHGVDASRAMLARLAGKPGGDRVRTVAGDMVDDLPPGPFALAFVAYNTLFNLRSAARQAACFRAVATRLRPGGVFVVEAFVPAADGTREHVGVRSLSADRVVLAVSRTDPVAQTAEGQYVEFTEAGGVRLRPWSIRWSTLAELDAMAREAGLHVDQRWEGFDRAPFGPESSRHVTVYRRT